MPNRAQFVSFHQLIIVVEIELLRTALANHLAALTLMYTTRERELGAVLYLDDAWELAMKGDRRAACPGRVPAFPFPPAMDCVVYIPYCAVPTVRACKSHALLPKHRNPSSFLPSSLLYMCVCVCAPVCSR
jgi:hypothetical protein